jgi:hypothetical protein
MQVVGVVEAIPSPLQLVKWFATARMLSEGGEPAQTVLLAVGSFCQKSEALIGPPAVWLSQLLHRWLQLALFSFFQTFFPSESLPLSLSLSLSLSLVLVSQ